MVRYKAKWRQKKAKRVKKKRLVEYGEKMRDCIWAEERSEKANERQRRTERQRKGKEPGVIYASLGTRLYLFFSPCELFYIGDLIKSNKSQCAHTHKYAHTATTAPPDSGIVNISSRHPLHPEIE